MKPTHNISTIIWNTFFFMVLYVLIVFSFLFTKIQLSSETWVISINFLDALDFVDALDTLDALDYCYRSEAWRLSQSVGMRD